MERDSVTDCIIGLAIDVHKALGPGLLESAYEECLCHELAIHNVPFRRQVPLPVEYKGIRLACAYRMDVVVADRVILELKTVESLMQQHQAQLLTYLRLSGLPVGLLINFNVPLLREGIVRMVL